MNAVSRRILRASFSCLFASQLCWRPSQLQPPHPQPPRQFCCGRTALPEQSGILRVDKPILTPYLPAQNPTHTAIVVCPGGGYAMLAIDKEGTQIRPLAQRSRSGGLRPYLSLRSSLSPPDPAARCPACDSLCAHPRQRTLDRSRSASALWDFLPGAISLPRLGTHFDNGNPDATDPIEHASSRPDFMVLAYPVISMQPGITHNGSLHNLLGEEPNPMLENELSNETQVTPQTPPTFLFSTTNDETVPVMNSVLFYEALLRAGVPAELHIFEQGHHGSGLAQDNPQLRMWPILLQNWLHLHGWMAAAAQ